MLTIEQLFEPLTEEQVKAKLYELAAFLGLPTTSWFSGAPTRVLIAIIAKIFGTFLSPLLVYIAKSGFLDDAEAGWLTLLAYMHFGVSRREATFATGNVDLVNAGGGVFAFEIGEAVFKNGTTNATYTNTEAISLATLGSQTVALRALTIGTAGNADIGAIDTIVTSMPEVTVSNAAAFVGVDEETDPELRVRCKDKLGALSPMGPKAAYRFVAVTPELNGGANINRVKVIPAVGDSSVTVVVAAPEGAPTGPDVTLVQTGINTWAEPDTVLASAVAAINYDHSVDATVYVNAASGRTNAEWETLIKNELISWVRTLPIEGLELTPGARLIPYRTVLGVIERARGSTGEAYNVLHAALASQVDVSLPGLSVVRLAANDITLTINQVTVAA